MILFACVVLRRLPLSARISVLAVRHSQLVNRRRHRIPTQSVYKQTHTAPQFRFNGVRAYSYIFVCFDCSSCNCCSKCICYVLLCRSHTRRPSRSLARVLLHPAPLHVIATCFCNFGMAFVLALVYKCLCWCVCVCVCLALWLNSSCILSPCGITCASLMVSGSFDTLAIATISHTHRSYIYKFRFSFFDFGCNLTFNALCMLAV